ncbi:hypothetical protein [Ureaplasma canigenitalium]|uniref:hypothetical protein n=1 Tax=Ureaplasma canigenitalium TaxID=42092 RepID=UPI0004E137A5|nr:hypothetical protein [Ureaplasma canigenitalium]
MNKKLEIIVNLENITKRLRVILLTFYEAMDLCFNGAVDTRESTYKIQKEEILTLKKSFREIISTAKIKAISTKYQFLNDTLNSLLKEEKKDIPLIDAYYQACALFIVIPYIIEDIYTREGEQFSYKKLARFIVKNNHKLFTKWDDYENKFLEILNLGRENKEISKDAFALIKNDQKKSELNRFKQLFNHYILVTWDKAKSKYIFNMMFVWNYWWLLVIFGTILIVGIVLGSIYHKR